ncbi:unnamed protein product [Mytilus edulis]|uniref:Uncharacterized protein n=1 Tax=Mytilus edulis TaxID=6550 RepID=A0A8S3TEF4_MYTED|nr:unnamed protein product [Mytilus edulis]
MSTDKSLSVNFYQYLCQKVGSPEEVRVRRLTYITDDIGQAGKPQITSGSKGEGLELKGSDLDLMYLDTRFTVHESERDAVLRSIRSNKIPLVMNTEDTQPCFTHLLLHLDFLNDYKIKPEFKQMFEKSGPMITFSNEQYKQFYVLKMPLIESKFGNLFKSLRQISRTFIEQMKGKRNIESALHSIICLGIGLQMMGDIINARGYFQIAADLDILQITRAEARLSSLSHYY